jgi:hypothetical protein
VEAVGKGRAPHILDEGGGGADAVAGSAKGTEDETTAAGVTTIQKLRALPVSDAKT